MGLRMSILFSSWIVKADCASGFSWVQADPGDSGFAAAEDLSTVRR
jgi:hypothetical protein